MLRDFIGKKTFQILRSTMDLRPVRRAFIWWVVKMSDSLPVEKISETDNLICFYHPQPAHPIHILLMQKRDIQDFSQLDPDAGDILEDLVHMVNELVVALNLQAKGYRLIVNGGKYQEFPQLHFHLISEEQD